MTRLILAVAVLVAGLTTATAQMSFRYDEVVDTRYGELHVEGTEFDRQLWLNQEPLPLPTEARWWVQWSEQGAGAYDWALVAHHHGGNSCGGADYIMQLSANATAISRPINGCTGVFLAIRHGEGWIELDRTSRDIMISHVTIRWDGDAYSETRHFAPIVLPAGAGPDVARWIGRHPYDLFGDAGERARFGSVMQVWELQDLADRMIVSSDMNQIGEWVIGTGCMPHSCGIEMGALGLRIRDGAIAAVIHSEGQELRSFGLSDDQTFQRAIADAMP